MNLKYIKVAVYIMTALILIGIPVVIVGMMKNSHTPTVKNLADNFPMEEQSSVSKVVELEKFGDINININKDLTCLKPQFQGRLMIIPCTDSITKKHKIISVDLYKGAVLGNIIY